MKTRFALIAGIVLLTGITSQTTLAAGVKEVSPQKYEPIKAKIIDNTPENFTINVRTLANFGANDEAPIFALYTSRKIPDTCADFTHLKLRYEKPRKYQRKFNLSKNKEVLTALDQYKCVVVQNIPAK
ncbi:MAG: hypothetical protein IT559_01400 [Alphaproteobacteria bacterium]|nr:hypothetical protein [Alphaproteobacteria bacterium]